MSADFYKKAIAVIGEKCGMSPTEIAFAQNHPSEFLKAISPGPMFHVILEDCGNNKIGCIKEIRAITGLGLKEAKDVADNVPSRIGGEYTEKDAVRICASFIQYGARIMYTKVA